MKFRNILLFGALIFLVQCSPKVAETIQEPIKETSAQSWRSSSPAAGPARQVNLGDYNVFEMENGLTVIVVENHKLPRVSYQLSLKNKPGSEGEEIGFKGIAGDLFGRGTKTMTKSDIDKKIDYIGASFSTFATGMFGSSLTKHQGTLLDVMSDVLFNASFPKDEFDKIMTQSLSGIQTTKTDPNSIASNVAAVVNYGANHPYGEVTTEETLNKVQLATCKKYIKQHFKPNNAYLTIVGDITVDQAKSTAQNYFGKWKKGKAPSYDYPMPKRPNGTNVHVANKDGAVQSVISVTYPVDLQPGSQESLNGSVMNSILGGGVFLGRLMQNLREDKAFTYGARSSLRSDDVIGSFNAGASVRTEVTDSSIVEFIYEMNRIATEPVSAKDLRLAKNSMAGSFARGLESPQTLARYAQNIVRYNLPEDHYETYLERLDAVSVGDIKAIATKYVTADKANIVVVGNKDEISEKLLRFDSDGEIDYYDAFGKKLEAPTMEIPAGMTGATVISDYITALGGKDKLMDLKSMEYHYSMNVMGQDATVDIYQQSPNKVAMRIGTEQMVFQEQKFNGTKAFAGGMGGAQTVTEGPLFDQSKEMAKMFKQLDYLGDGYILELKGIENVDGADSYKVMVKDPNGEEKTEFYNVKTSMLIREVQVQEANGQTMTITQDFADYKEVDGIPFPHTLTTIGAMPMPMVMKASSIVVNGKIDAAKFTIE